MPTTNNYTFSNITYTITEGDNISTEAGSTAIITLIPNEGYALDANNLLLSSGFSNTYVSSVAFAQNGDNVDCTITFDVTETMPANNLTIPLCIDGNAELVLPSISGIYNTVVGSNVTPTSETSTVYSNSGAAGTTEVLFTKTFTAASGYYFETLPTATLTTGVLNNYNIVETFTEDVNNNVITYTFTVNYTYPIDSVENDVIDFTANAEEIFVLPQEITNWTINEAGVSKFGETRVLTVYGAVGAAYTIDLDNQTTQTSIANNVTMDSSGIQSYNVVFPSNDGGTSVIWDIDASGDLATSAPISKTLIQRGSSLEISLSTSQISAGSACGVETYPATKYISSDFVLSNGSIIYNDADLTTVYNGSDGYFKYSAANASFQISSVGVVSNYNICPEENSRTELVLLSSSKTSAAEACSAETQFPGTPVWHEGNLEVGSKVFEDEIGNIPFEPTDGSWFKIVDNAIQFGFNEGECIIQDIATCSIS